MLGGAISFANFGVHAVMTGIIVVVTRHTARATDDLHVFIRLFALLLVTLSVLTVAHIAEIEIWAIFFRSEGVFADPGVSAFECDVVVAEEAHDAAERALRGNLDDTTVPSSWSATARRIERPGYIDEVRVVCHCEWRRRGQFQADRSTRPGAV